MKKIKLESIDEEITYEKLENGLDVYLYNKKGCTNNYVTFTTKFGSIHNEFIPIGESKMKRVPNGVAHFLEHKVFVQENGPQPEEFFARSGALCNAYTTFKNTTYLFSGPTHLKENISFLLDYVQTPYFTEENVDSEKGIITQEIHMCDDNPTDVMYEYIRKNCFYNNSFKDSIIGTVDDIKSIDKEILFSCYNTFYHPQNMFLVITGNFDEKEILDEIANNQINKSFKSLKKIGVKKYEEPDDVVKEKEIISMDTPIPKISYNIKVSLTNVEIPIRKYNLYLFIVFSILFDDTSLFDLEAKKENIITNSIYLNLLNCDTHLLISLINETSHYEKLIELIEKTLDKIEITEEDLERKKRVLISNELFSFENIEVINDMIVDNIIFDNSIESNIIGLIRSLNKEELENILKKIKLNNKSIVILKNNSEKLKNDIYNIPIIYVFVFFQFMLFILLIISKLVNINASILIITLIILLLIYCILFYFLVFSKKYIINKEDNLKCKTEYQKQWLIKLEILINSNSDKELYSLYEKVKYMDKVQSDATEEVDNKINSIFENIGDDITISQINELTKLIDKRNIINKNSK